MAASPFKGQTIAEAAPFHGRNNPKGISGMEYPKSASRKEYPTSEQVTTAPDGVGLEVYLNGEFGNAKRN